MMKETSSPHRHPPEDERTLRLEIALRQSEKQAMAGRLAASVMHEINNPSQAIADLVYLIGKEADHPELVRTRAAQIEEQLVRIQYSRNDLVATETRLYVKDATLHLERAIAGQDHQIAPGERTPVFLLDRPDQAA